MKQHLLTAGFVLCATLSNAQGLTQNAEGKSTILFKGTAISLDIAKTDVSFGINNLVRAVRLSTRKDNIRPIFGIDVSAKSEEGIGGLFSKGDLIPNAKANAFFGFSISNRYVSDIEEAKQNMEDELQKNSVQNALDFHSTITAAVNDMPSDYKSEKEGLLKCTNNVSKFRRQLQKIDPGTDTVLESLVSGLGEIADSLDKQYLRSDSSIRASLRDNYRKLTANNLRIFSMYGFGGINAISFKHFDSVNNASYAKSFTKEEFRGGNIGIGFNYQVTEWRFGITYEYEQTHNFSALDKVDYTLETLNAAGNQSLKQEKEITAYSGEYGKVEVNRLNADIIYSLRLDKDANTFCYINPYFRSKIASGILLCWSIRSMSGPVFISLIKTPSLSAVCTSNFPTSKITLKNKKPAGDQNIRPALKRLTFGIVAKMSISSMLKLQ